MRDLDGDTGGGIQVIARAAAILRALEGKAEGLTMADLSTATALPRSTVQRIVAALAAESLLTASPRAKIRLGTGLIRLAQGTDLATDRLVRPVLQRLSADLGETVDLSVLQGATAIFIDQVVGSNRLVAMSAVGEGFPVHCTANGKALLACLPPERRRVILGKRLDKLTSATVTDTLALEREIQAFYPAQVAWDLEEHAEGISAAGTAFIDPLGRDYAISIPVPTTRFEKKQTDLQQALRQAQDQILDLLPGARRPGA